MPVKRQPMSKSKAICILGMHRSGTSAVTRLVNLCGAYLGEESILMPPVPGINPEGFWERNDIFELTESLMRKFKTGWDTVLPLPDNWQASPEIVLLKEQLIKLIIGNFQNHALWAWKDPRSMLLFPLWEKVLADLDIEVCCIFVIRNPLDVARSLEKRNAFSVEKSLGIWFNYNIQALRSIRNVKTAFISYEKLFADSGYELDKCAEILDIVWPNCGREVNDAIKTFVRPDLCHSMSTVEDLEKINAPSFVIELYGHLLELSQSGVRPDARVYARVDALYESFSAYASFFEDDVYSLWDANQKISGLNYRLAMKERHAETLNAQVFEINQEIQKYNGQLTILNSQLMEKNQEIARLKTIEDSATWKMAKTLLRAVDDQILPLYSKRGRSVRSLISRLVSAKKRLVGISQADETGLNEAAVEYYAARDGKPSRIRKISFMTTTFDQQSKRYRVYNLIEELTQLGIECVVFHETIGSLEPVMDSDLLIVFRVPFSDKVGTIMEKIREKNIPIVFDVDDLIFIPECMKYFDGLQCMSASVRKNFIEVIPRWKATLIQCDAVTCSTETISRYAAELGKDAFVIANTINNAQLDLSEQLLRSKEYSENVKIGYFSGTRTHNKDFEEVADALYEILTDFPSVEFHLVGELDLEERFSGFGDRVVVKSLMSHLDYITYKAAMDINIAPLELNNPFTDSKSELKIFEAALVKIPTVASPAASYKACITDGVDGFLAASKQEWYDALSLLIDNPSLRRKIGETAQEQFVRRFSIKNVIPEVLRTYEEIITRHRTATASMKKKRYLPGKLPRFSIVSVLYNKEKEIAFFLKALAAQNYPGNCEIVLVNDRTRDNSVRVVRDFMTTLNSSAEAGQRLDVKLIDNPTNIGNCGSRNIGIRHAEGDIVVIIDADCIVNEDFLYAHAEAHAYGDGDIVIGPLNLETNGQDPLAVLQAYEKDTERMLKDSRLQDPINHRSFLNCITRNISIRKEVISGDLFDDSFSYSEDERSGFGWEDVEMGYRLYKQGARIKFTSEAFSVHISHPSSADERTKPLRSLRNFRKLYEKHPELLLAARQWTLDTYQKICDWVDQFGHAKNDDRLYLDHLFQRFIPAPFNIGRHRRLKILTHRWHCAHQYELYKLPHEFTLATGTGTGITDYWEYDKRPLPPNAQMQDIREVRIKDYDLAIVHFDENVLAPENTNGIIAPAWGWGETLKWFRKNVKLPMVAVCHGTPQFHGQYNIHYREPDLMQVIEKERVKLVDFMCDVLVIANSFQAQREWDFRKSKVIWHGFDPAEFYPARYERGILAMLEKAMLNRPHYNGYFQYREVFDEFPGEYAPTMLHVPEPNVLYAKNSNAYAYAKFRNYVDEIRQYSIYFNPTLRSPMPRSRGEAMLCGLVTVSMNNHDVDMFIRNGVNGFYSNDAYELREYLRYLLKNPEQCRKIGLEGRKTAMDIFNNDRYLKAWDDTIAEVL
ncbi:MAG: glycosyl transferase [Thermodesulfovibrio sp.]|nr:glycosyl transferase [Thermodesulfovibrio sp.]